MRFQFEPEIPFEAQNQMGIIIMNLGTPEAPTAQAVRPYLRQFLSDFRVVELPRLLWQPILRGIILPFRSGKSAHGYEKVWLKEGSPLAVFTRRQAEGLRQRLPESVHIVYAMTYGKPSVDEALIMLKSKGVGRVVVVPLYPQYAGSSGGAALDKVMLALSKQRNQMSVHTVSRFYDDVGYIRACVEQIRNYRAEHGSGDKLMFSFHGIPQRHHDKGDPYPLECRATAHLIATELGLAEQDYIVSFQSQFGKDKWIEPSTQTLFDVLPKQGVEKLDVFCPGFVSDCLETMEEIAIAGREQFYEAGGTQFHYIPCLNDNPVWLDALADLIKKQVPAWLPE
ncbi:MAG: ferrochelatase [Alysiella sp.]|uniref:ferrochelatase n=1 Tax=Alysiella sp. TaxID=1872483 RepID=UPI0026DB11D3|nr:ferrochelatase [Alysiella sp.]MDO4433774.1 ferrochelatase [Alysiella sp.]